MASALNALVRFEESSTCTNAASDDALPSTLPKAAVSALPVHSASSLDLHTPSVVLGGSESHDKRLNVSSPPATYKPRLPNDTPASPIDEIAIDELDTSRLPSPETADAVDALQSFSNPRMNRWRVLSACLTCLGNGMNDSAPGALLPYIESHYSIGYAVVSLMFVGNAIGFIAAAFFIHALDIKLGRSKTLMLCDLMMIIGYTTIVFTPPFPLLPISFIITGFGMATTLALNNVFCANLSNAMVILGFFHGAYGIGGVIAPVLATTLVTNGLVFSRFYIIMVGLRAVSFVFGGWAFWQFEGSPGRSSKKPRSALEQSDSGRVDETFRDLERESSKLEQLKQALKSRTTLFGALFIFAYQAAEVNISSWVISFLINYRGNNPSHVGYVTSGFWGGIALGRFLLSYVAHRIGEKAFVYGVVLGSFGFQLLVWFTPNVIGDSVAIAILGLLLGPIYPCASRVFTRLLPGSVQNTAMAFMSSAGSTGGALIPFLTGVLAQASGTWVLNPICIAMFFLMEISWFALPKLAKRRE